MKLLGICFWRKGREERIWAEYMGEKGGWYLDAAGKTLGRAMYGYSGPDGWLRAKKSAGCTGCSSPPPEKTVKVDLTISQVIFEDETVWQPAKERR